MPSRAIAVFGTAPYLGTITFDSTGSVMKITGSVAGFQPNSKHGVHIHTYGVLTNSCNDPGPHYNPSGVKHGSLTSSTRHPGDLGNMDADAQGTLTASINDFKMDLREFVGRAIVIHQDEDDLGQGSAAASSRNGNSGPRLTCAAIVLAEIPAV
ncbi:hypothetical protein Ciccas_011200 [Cichlidogyrus casuarinus]|uniref:Superoxide dismutase copper/zinc binding domain-containing protein n=1 Tax=Cichlidogyrus casuarinus TaxID=1844966 RepID=A0ABD2PRY2_9PLAT